MARRKGKRKRRQGRRPKSAQSSAPARKGSSSSPQDKQSDDSPSPQRLIAQTATFEGPIPPPSVLDQYDKLVPGAADRLIAMAEQEGRTSRELRTKALDSDIADRRAARIEARIGQFFGLLIGIVAITAGAYVSVNGSEWGGGLIGTGGVAALVAVFVYGRSNPSRGFHSGNS